MSTEKPTGATTPNSERADLLASLATQRHFLTFTVRDLTDEQARQRTTVSELTLGGLIKHVTETEESWARFIVEGPVTSHKPFEEWSQEDFAARAASFQLQPAETLAGALAEYQRIASATDALVETADLDLTHPLPEAPWFAPGARRSVRGALLHIIAETAQHAGHADIIRESLDGAKTMG